jgi:hypothetical protein
MALDTAPATAPDVRVSPVAPDRAGRRATASLFLSGGLLMALGGQLHPHGSGETVDEHLLSMFESPTWYASHAIALAGSVLCALAFVAAWRTRAFGAAVQRWLPVTAGLWALGAAELVPHLLAAREAHALEHHHATPVLDLHLVLQLVATPAVGVTGVLVAVAVARAARTRAATVLAVFAVLGGVLYAVSAPLVVVTGNPAFTVLFPFQAGLAIWMAGTGVRLFRP